MGQAARHRNALKTTPALVHCKCGAICGSQKTMSQTTFLFRSPQFPLHLASDAANAHHNSH